jgi:outer membrane protein TolC
MQRPERIAIALLSIVLGGCAGSALDMAPPRPDRPWAPATDTGGQIVPARTRSAVGADHVLPSNPAAAALAAPPALDTAHAYTLAELIDIAQSNHPDTRIAWNNARHAALAAGIAESTYLPHLTASVVAGHRSSHGSSTLGSLDTDSSGSATGSVSALSLHWLLFDFGQRDAVVEAAHQLSIASNIAFTAAHQRVIHDVCLAYYANAAAQSRVVTADEALRNAHAVEAAADERRRHGVGTVVEVAQARQATAQARFAQVQAQGAAQNATLALTASLGVSPLVQLKVADPGRRPLSMALARRADGLVSQALARRPDVLAAYAAEKASLAGVRAAQADFRPKVFVAATGSYGTGHLGVTAIPPIGSQSGTFNVSGSQTAATVLLGVSVPLYDGQLRNSRLKQARADADKAVATSERLKLEAVREIVAAQNAVATTLAAHDASIALEAAARTTYDAAFDAYRHGVGTITAAIDAATARLQAEDAATNAHSAALSAAATLAFAAGALGSAPREP